MTKFYHDLQNKQQLLKDFNPYSIYNTQKPGKDTAPQKPDADPCQKQYEYGV